MGLYVNGDNLFTWVTPCKVALMHAHCLNPMHTLLLPFSRNSILLLRPNHRILFPGNFYPFMWCTVCAMRMKATRTSQGRLRKKKIQSLTFSFSDYFPRFHKQVLRSGKQHIEREMEGRRRKLDEKKGGVYGVIIQPPPKKPVFLLFLRLSHLSFPRMQI